MSLPREHLILVVVVLLLASVPLRSQTRVTPAFYNKPAELNLERSIKRTFSNYLRQQANDYYRQRSFDQLAPEPFYPIGWSKDGKFAYYFEPDRGVIVMSQTLLFSISSQTKLPGLLTTTPTL
jgi:hypothetical protein